ncbi:MAG: hypothetical protein RIG77_11570 [Cyclobacteriaceae bacterium]
MLRFFKKKAKEFFREAFSSAYPELDVKSLQAKLSQLDRYNDSLDELKILNAKNILQNWAPNDLSSAEFKVFSQWGDDGIIQYLVEKIEPEFYQFVEFGVGNYREANTRFLLINNNWTGLVMDCDQKNIDQIKHEKIYWKYDLKVRRELVTIENVNKIISNEGFKGGIGLLHIDIDGNDYWIWKSITCIEPLIVIVEYNSVFGIDRPITIPYNEKFTRDQHHSGLYLGASLLALCDLANEKGYYFIGSNSAGNNAYFVRKDKIGDLKPLSAHEGYVESKFRESRNRKGELTYARFQERIELIRGLEVYNTRSGKIEQI